MFKRPINPLMKKLLKKQYASEVNADNISTLKGSAIKKIFKDEEQDVRNTYLHNVINEWWENSSKDEYDFLKLKKIIKKTKIDINQIEEHNLFLIEERIFSITRHIKTLEVDFPLLAKEIVGAKFVKATLYEHSEKLEEILRGDLLLTNRRLIIDAEEPMAFYWSAMTGIKYKKYGFEFINKEVVYVVRIHDQETLNNTIKNFIKKRVK